MRFRLTFALALVIVAGAPGVAKAQTSAADATEQPAPADGPGEGGEPEADGTDTPNTADARTGDDAPAVPGAGATRADDASGTEPVEVPRETAATVANAPRPDRATEYQVAPPGPGFGRTLWRIGGFVPYWTTRIVLAPVRGLLWVYERYGLDVRFREIFFTEDGTIGVFPLITNEAGFGLTVGAKFLHNSVFGQGEKLSLTVTARGAAQAYASLVANSGDRWRGFRLRGNLTYNSLRRARFFGVGNEDALVIDDDARISEPVDPFSSRLAVSTRYSFDELSARLGADFTLAEDLVVQVIGEYIRRDYDPSEDDTDRYAVFTGEVYDTSRLTGFDEGLNTLTGLLVLQYDRSDVTTRYNSLAVPSRGYRATSLIGYAYGLGEDPSNFWRLSAALEGFFNLYGGDRVLALRGFYETVSADREDVPFDQLPTLGGNTLLRGYVRGRFRDSSVALVSAEYLWPVLNTVSAFAFVDAGVPFGELDDLSLEDPRVGFGVGLQLQTAAAAIGRFDVSSSINGGLLINLTFRPFFQVDRRAQ